MNHNCIFCKIAGHEISAKIVYEDEDFMAFLDINPVNPGHTLVIPKKHYRWVWDVPNIDRYYLAVQKVALALKKVFETDWIVSAVFGEEIDHAHIWLVPRFANDGHGGALDPSNRKKITEKKLNEIAEKIRQKI